MRDAAYIPSPDRPIPVPKIRFRRIPGYVAQHPDTRCPGHKRYLLDCRQYDQVRAEVAYACEICRTPEIESSHGLLVLDHDANLGFWALRGVLCGRCNGELGRDTLNPSAVATYLANPWHRRVGRNYLPVPIPEIPLATAEEARVLLDTAKTKYQASKGVDPAAFRAACDELKFAVRVATKAGMRQRDIVRAIDRIWTRELVSYRLQEGGRWVVRNLYTTAGALKPAGDQAA